MVSVFDDQRDARAERGGSMAVGRPTDFDAETAAAIVVAVLAGHSRGDAARSAGVSPSAFYHWLQLGRAGDQRYASFAADVATAGRAARRAKHGAARERRGESGARARV